MDRNVEFRKLDTANGEIGTIAALNIDFIFLLLKVSGGYKMLNSTSMDLFKYQFVCKSLCMSYQTTESNRLHFPDSKEAEAINKPCQSC